MSAALSWFPVSPQAGEPPCNLLKLTKEDICHLAGITARTFERRVKDQQDGVVSIELPQRSRNGRTVRKFVVATLPADLRAKVTEAYHARPRPVAVEETKPARKAHEVAPLFTGVNEQAEPDRGVSPALLAELSPKARKQAEARRNAILPLIEFDLPGRRVVYSALKLQDGRAVTTKELLSQYLAETLKVEGKRVSRGTLWNWLRAWSKGGDAALGRKPRADRGSSNFFTRYPAAARLVESEWLKPAASFTRAQNAIYRDQQLLQIPDAELPDLKTVTRYLKALPAPAALLARHGQKAWHDKCGAARHAQVHRYSGERRLGFGPHDPRRGGAQRLLRRRRAGRAHADPLHGHHGHALAQVRGLLLGG